MRPEPKNRASTHPPGAFRESPHLPSKSHGTLGCAFSCPLAYGHATDIGKWSRLAPCFASVGRYGLVQVYASVADVGAAMSVVGYCKQSSVVERCYGWNTVNDTVGSVSCIAEYYIVFLCI